MSTLIISPPDRLRLWQQPSDRQHRRTGRFLCSDQTMLTPDADRGILEVAQRAGGGRATAGAQKFARAGARINAERHVRVAPSPSLYRQALPAQRLTSRHEEAPHSCRPSRSRCLRRPEAAVELASPLPGQHVVHSGPIPCRRQMSSKYSSARCPRRLISASSAIATAAELSTSAIRLRVALQGRTVPARHLCRLLAARRRYLRPS